MVKIFKPLVILKHRLARATLIVERMFDVVIPRRGLGNPEIDPYFGHATPTTVILRGRVLSRKVKKNVKAVEADASLWTNFKAMIALFNTREMSNIRITCLGHETRSDEEGYFELILPRTKNQTGWIEHKVCFGDGDDCADLAALLPTSEAEFGIISDIDDTLIKTEAWSLSRNLWNSLTGNAHSRYVFPDAIQLIQTLHKQINPVFYVSSSPWNLHGFLTEIFDRAGLVRGPKFLRILGISESKFITGKRGHHKSAAIDEILAANPNLTFILMGDTGQHDAFVYHEVLMRHPERIRQIILRAPQPGLSKESQICVDKIKATKTPIFVGETYKPLLDEKLSLAFYQKPE